MIFVVVAFLLANLDKIKQSYVLNIVIRDDEHHFINVAIWGDLEYMRDLNDRIQIYSASKSQFVSI